MRFALALLFVAPFVSSFTVLRRQTVNNIPACASPCLQQPEAKPCEASDTQCLCLNFNWLNAVATCTYSSCSLEEADAAVAAGEEWCRAAGIEPYTPYPACANPCVDNPPASSSCAVDDGTCLCKDPNWVGPIVSCFKSSCTGQDLTTAETVGKAACRAWGVDISSSVGA